MGYIVLEGGAEFGGLMALPDRRALALAGGVNAKISIIPAAAAPNNDNEGAGRNGVRWFQSLGATDVVSLPLIDRLSANDPGIVDALHRSRLIYLLGGATHHLAQTLAGSDGWRAMKKAHGAGAVMAGSSAGAMVLCDGYYDHKNRAAARGLDLIPNACVLPHHNTFGKSWAARLTEMLPGATLIGIDEETGAINDGPHGQWRVYGRGAVTLYRKGLPVEYRPGNLF